MEKNCTNTSTRRLTLTRKIRNTWLTSKRVLLEHLPRISQYKRLAVVKIWNRMRSIPIKKISVGWLMLLPYSIGIWMIIQHYTNPSCKKFSDRVNQWTDCNLIICKLHMLRLKRLSQECFSGKRKLYRPNRCSYAMTEPNSPLMCGKIYWKVSTRTQKNEIYSRSKII